MNELTIKPTSIDMFSQKYGLMNSSDMKPRNELSVPVIFVTDSVIKEGADSMEIRAHAILADNSSVACYVTIYNQNGR